jgi:choline dehydrogenase
VTLNDIANSPVKKLIAGMQYVLFQKGPLTSNGI